MLRDQIEMAKSIRLYIGIGLLTASFAASQTKENSAADIVRHVAETPSIAAFIVPCGEDSDLQRQGDSLSKLGVAAIPEIEMGLDWIDNQDVSAEVVQSQILTEVYAKILGPKAYPRLKEMIAKARIPSVQLNLDNAVAISLGLTSYVSHTRATVMRPHSIPTNSCRQLQSLDTLNAFLLSWEVGDRAVFGSTLTPRGRASLETLLHERSWGQMRAAFWHAGSEASIGYKFENALRVSESGYSIDTTFTTKSGATCGQHQLRFDRLPREDSVRSQSYASGVGFSVLVMQEVEQRTYYIDNTDLGALLELVSNCASRE
jgi:hypothetical protein